MFNPLTDWLQLYQLQPAGFEFWVLSSEFHDHPAAWFELIASWGTMAITRLFQRLILQDGVDALGMPFEKLCEMAPDRLGQDSCYWLDSGAIKRDLDWEPQIDWKEGLGEMVDWGRKYLGRLRNWPTSYTMRG